jgi:hypothetical protein
MIGARGPIKKKAGSLRALGWGLRKYSKPVEYPGGVYCMVESSVVVVVVVVVRLLLVIVIGRIRVE